MAVIPIGVLLIVGLPSELRALKDMGQGCTAASFTLSSPSHPLGVTPVTPPCQGALSSSTGGPGFTDHVALSDPSPPSSHCALASGHPKAHSPASASPSQSVSLLLHGHCSHSLGLTPGSSPGLTQCINHPFLLNSEAPSPKTLGFDDWGFPPSPALFIFLPPSVPV